MVQFIGLLALLPFVLTANGQSGTGTTTRYWDCCKPSCSWPGKAQFKQGPVQTCGVDDKPLNDGGNTASGCNDLIVFTVNRRRHMRAAICVCVLIVVHFVEANPQIAKNESMSIFGIHWDHVEAPMMVSIWILVASIAKILFHVNKKFGEALPDSALLIAVGLLLGFALRSTDINANFINLSGSTFFLYLLPPIMFDAGYFMPSRQLFENIYSVMLFAIFGTIFNMVTIGLTLGLCSTYGLFSVSFTYTEAFLFSSLISAVDPVAVITVFEEVNVNEFLFINVFGEALFNDGIAAAAFQIFDKILVTNTTNLNVEQCAIYGFSFVGVALGGVLVGIVAALICSLATRFTQRVKIVGPVFIFVFPYMSYLVAEMFGVSAILAICCCGIVMKQYVNRNITHEAASSVKYFIKMLANSSETVVFMFLGLSAMSSHQYFDYWFVGVTVVACLIYRTIGVIIQCAVLNRYQNKKFTMEDQFILSYGGLRGAIAFGLLSSLPNSVAAKDMFTTTTIVVICFTVFLQGSTIRPLLSLLKVEKAEERQIMMVEQVYNKYFDYTMTGIEDIVGQKGKHAVRDWFERLNAKILKPIFIKHTQRSTFDASDIVRAYKKLSLREAISNLDLTFMASQENVEALYGMLRNLMKEIQSQNLSSSDASNVVAALNDGNEDDIKDDYIAAIRRPPSRAVQQNQRQTSQSTLQQKSESPLYGYLKVLIAVIFIVRVNAQNQTVSSGRRKFRIAIVGCGFAGLAAFGRLQETKSPDFHVDIFEASNRVGGRVYPVKFGLFNNPTNSTMFLEDGYLQNGAQFINGANNPIYKKAERLGVLTGEEIDDDNFFYSADYHTGDCRIEKELIEEFGKFVEPIEESFLEIARDSAVWNTSIGALYDKLYSKFLNRRKRSHDEVRYLNSLSRFYRSYYESEWSAPLGKISLYNYAKWNDRSDKLTSFTLNKKRHRLWSLLYRFSQVFPGWLSDFFDRSKTIYFVYAFVHLFIYATVLLPMLIGQKWDWRETRLQFLTENPDLLDRIDRPMICFTNNKNLRSFQLYILIIVVFVVIFGKILHGILIHLLRKTKRRSTITSTYKFQLMLLNSINCQIVIAYVFFVFPVLIQGVLVYNNNPHVGKWATVMSALIGFHGWRTVLSIGFFFASWILGCSIGAFRLEHNVVATNPWGGYRSVAAGPFGYSSYSNFGRR
ncbi:Sodium/hydrogen exchanger [Aphelenchoides besseyi]|nr:Sodium/hydrogen exchanger [Aphelenchoides besseyi]